MNSAPKMPSPEEREAWRKEHLTNTPGKTFVQAPDGSLNEVESSIKENSAGVEILPNLTSEQKEELMEQKKDLN